MTDSGFSSAASNRSSSAVIRPSHLNSLNSRASKSTTSAGFPGDNLCSSGQGNLPKPSTLFQSSGCKSVVKNRFVYPKSHGGYSPSLYSPKDNSPMHMSPMSSLAFDFRDLNTSRETSDTPTKRLSLSSVSSLDSPHLIHPSPAALSFASSINSPQVIQDDDSRTAYRVQRVRAINVIADARTSRKQIFRPLRNSASDRKTNSETLNVEVGSNNTTLIGSQSGEDSFDVESAMECSVEQNSRFKPICDQEGCFADTPSPLDLSEMEAKFDQRAFQDKDTNIQQPGVVGDGKLNLYRRFNSMPASQINKRQHAGKENSPVYEPSKLSKHRGSIGSPSPMHSISSLANPSPFHSLHRRRHSAFPMSPSIVSSPLAPNFASSSSSAFCSVSQGGAMTLNLHRPSTSKMQSKKNEEQIREDAEKKLRDAKSPTNGSKTPEKSVVPGSISSLSVRSTRLSRPASAAPFYEGKPYAARCISPIRRTKRSLDSSSTSLICSPKRHKRSSTVVNDLNSTRRKMAFSSKDRKSKSADATVLHSSPMETLKSDFRPISAPAQFLAFDDDEPLSHSRLCSSNDTDSDSDDAMMTSDLSQRDVDEKLLEEMLKENKRERQEATSDDVLVKDRSSTATPAGIDGLITAPLLLSASVKEDEGSGYNKQVPKPRELFRSPSAPPVVPSRRSRLILKRSGKDREDGTPVGLRRRQTTDFDDIPTLPEATTYEMEEEPNTSLNRSRSFNELDVMKAVDLGCSNDNLIGDFSRVCSLKTVVGKCQDLKYITPLTLIELINNRHNAGCFEIIDCRYPYEHEGGHVMGAECVWEEETLFKRYFHNPKPMWTQSNGTYKPPVLVFYCEFSSERGPRMARALRSKDRCLNRYPHLHYPEIYILRNGFKNFFYTEGTEDYCVPAGYRPMAHRDFTRELRLCRMKSKSWAEEKSKNEMFGRRKRR